MAYSKVNSTFFPFSVYKAVRFVDKYTASHSRKLKTDVSFIYKYIYLFLIILKICWNYFTLSYCWRVGGRDSTVGKVLFYKSEGRSFDPSWCRWTFH